MEHSRITLLERCNAFVIALGNKLSWIYLGIVVISFYEVMMRYAFNRPTVWVHETSLALAGIMMVYGGLYAFAKDKHISVFVVVDLFPKKIKAIFMLVAHIISLVYIVLLSISTIMITLLAVFSPEGMVRLERSGSSWNSIFPAVVKIFMSVSLVLFALLIAVHVYSKIVRLCIKQKKG